MLYSHHAAPAGPGPFADEHSHCAMYIGRDAVADALTSPSRLSEQCFEHSTNTEEGTEIHDWGIHLCATRDAQALWYVRQHERAHDEDYDFICPLCLVV